MNKLKKESGSVLVFVTFMIVILLVMVGIGLDTGYLSLSRSIGQRAVDMAALAGAAGLAKGGSSPATAIEANIKQIMVDQNKNDYVDRTANVIDPTVNGKNVTLMKFDFLTGKITGKANNIGEANAVRVALEATNPYTADKSNSAVNTPAFLMPLARLLGANASASTAVNVSAVAIAKGLAGLPIALGGCKSEWVGQNAAPIPLRQVSSSDSSAVGSENSGWTTYTQPATSTKSLLPMVTAIVNCQSTGEVNVGTPICLGNGQNTPVQDEFGKIVDPTGESCYLAPIVKQDARFNQCDNPIQAFASICVRAVCQNNKNQSTDPADLCTFTGEGNTKNSIIAKVQSCNADLNTLGASNCYSLRLVREYNASTKRY